MDVPAHPAVAPLPMRDLIEEVFDGLATPFYFGQILVTKREGVGFVLLHRDDESLDRLHTYREAEDAVEIAKYDDAGNYRSLKTAPNLRHGWRLELATLEELRRALNYFYPSRLAVFTVWKRGHLKTTALRETLDRQSGMYRVAAKISDPQINDLVTEKFEPVYDQVMAACSRRPAADASASHSEAATVPLLCQEACNLLVADCRKVVKGAR